jgi:hypothetical protein
MVLWIHNPLVLIKLFDSMSQLIINTIVAFIRPTIDSCQFELLFTILFLPVFQLNQKKRQKIAKSLIKTHKN